MNSYEQKRQRRRNGLRNRAARLHVQAKELEQRARSDAALIPFGQPILIGHHSEKRDRRFRARIVARMDQAAALEDQAQAFEQRADSVGEGGISSDDPEAVGKLREQLQVLQGHQEKMKAANEALRRKDYPALTALGFDPADVARNQQPDFVGRVGFPKYALANNSANIRRIIHRIEQLENRPTESAEREVKGVRIVEDAEENRLMLMFPGKPAEDVRKQLRSHGFLWSPTRSAWVRKLNNAARYSASCVLDALPAAEASTGGEQS